jgi:hypothetical protein
VNIVYAISELYTRLDDARKSRFIVLTTPQSVKSLFLKYIDLLQQIKKTRKITDSTLNLYGRNIKRLIKEAESENVDDFTSDKTLAKLMSASNSTLANYVATCLVVLGLEKTRNKNRIEQLNMRLRELNGKVKNDTDKPKDNELVKWDAIVKLSDKLRNNFFKIEMKYNEAQEAMLLSFYSLFPPQRSEIFSNLIITTTKPTDKENNYLYRKSTNVYFLIINKHKTLRSTGEITEQITDKQLIKMLNRYIKLYNTKYLFQYNNDKSLSPSDISKMLGQTTKELGDKLGSSSMRHIYLTDKYSGVMKDLESDTKMMGNSVGVAVSNYIK